MPKPSSPDWKAPPQKTAGMGMTDDEMHFLAEVLKRGQSDPVIKSLFKKWVDLWAEWERAGKFQEKMERAGVGATEVDNIFKGLIPDIERFRKSFNEIMDHLITIANK